MACSSCSQNNHVTSTTNSNQTFCDCACGCNEVVCPVIQPCTEIIDSNCVLYTGSTVYCNNVTIVPTNSTLNDALANMTNFICLQKGLLTLNDIFCGHEIVIPAGSSLQDALDLLSGLICDIELTPGPQGIQGIQGPQGIQGVMGLTGPQGIPGSSGGAGATGATGPQGAQGIPGPVGPAGLNWQGSWSALGIYVPDDAVGFNGASWFCLNAVGPSASNPLIDPANWALLASEGAVGPAGPTGAAGVAGAAGATGPQGPIGLTGSQGIQGITGPTGAQGIQGIQGIPGTVGTTNIGKKLGGGIVIAEWDENGIQKGLIASLTDINSFIEWTVPAFTNTLIGPLAQSYSDGFGNTLAVLSQAGILNTTYAAGAARLHTGGGFTDWYLPALWELTMCYNAATIVNRVLGVNGFANNNYWSSTEAGAGSAWGQSFFNGAAISNFSKNSNVFVRAVRIHNL